MKITGDFSQIAKKIREYANTVEDRKLELAQRIAQQIAAVAQTLFDAVPVNIEPNGTEHSARVQVSVNRLGDVTWVVAEGQQAVFVEFGAGVYFNGSAGTSRVPQGYSKNSGGVHLGLTIGSYGKHYGRRNTWAYRDNEGNKVITHGTPASKPMYTATKLAVDKLYDLASGVFQ